MKKHHTKHIRKNNKQNILKKSSIIKNSLNNLLIDVKSIMNDFFIYDLSMWTIPSSNSKNTRKNNQIHIDMNTLTSIFIIKKVGKKVPIFVWSKKTPKRVKKIG